MSTLADSFPPQSVSTTVDYEDDVHCSTCGRGPVQTSRFKCFSCSKFELCLSCYRSVDEIHPVHAFLSIPDRPARPTPSIIGYGAINNENNHLRNDSDTAAAKSREQLRLEFAREHAIIQMHNRPNISGQESLSPAGSSLFVRHYNVRCFGCGAEIVGARYSCSICPSLDLCASVSDHILDRIHLTALGTQPESSVFCSGLIVRNARPTDIFFRQSP